MGASMPGAMPPPLRMLSTGPGCWFGHHSMDFQTITMSTAANIDNTAESRARCVGSSIARRNMRYPPNSSQQTRNEVSRGSQAHQIPQMIRPQMLPVTSVMDAKASETSVM